MGQIEWAMWANEQAVLSGVGLLMGSIIGVAGGFQNWEFAAYAIVASLLILLLEWPRSKRQKGNTIQRKFQLPFTMLLDKMLPVSSNYYIRFVLHIILSVPCCFLLPTLMGGLSLMIAAIIYLVAAIKGEQWRPVGLVEKSAASSAQPGASAIPQPVRPAPRLQQAQQDKTIEENTV